MAAEVVKACKDGILMTICCYATQQLVHQGPPSESEQGGGQEEVVVVVAMGKGGVRWGNLVCCHSFCEYGQGGC